MKKYKINIFSTFLLVALLFTSKNFAQQSDNAIPTKESKGWNYLVEPYVMFANMSGETGIGNLPDASIDFNTNDIFSNLKMGFMLYTEASNEKWNINSDILYMDISKSIKSNALIYNGQVTAKQLGWEVAGLYKIKPWFEVGLGVLLNSVSDEVNINTNDLIGDGITNSNESKTETWVDPMIVVVIKNKLKNNVFYSLRSEIGGFGIGSDFAWQVQAYGGYQFSELFQISGGYRAIGLDYENGSGSDRFLYNMDIYGPVVKFGFNF